MVRAVPGQRNGGQIAAQQATQDSGGGGRKEAHGETVHRGGDSQKKHLGDHPIPQEKCGKAAQAVAHDPRGGGAGPGTPVGAPKSA